MVIRNGATTQRWDKGPALFVGFCTTSARDAQPLLRLRRRLCTSAAKADLLAA
jgi:hypothetical protein